MNSASQADKNMAPDSGIPFDRLKKICLPDEKKVCLLGFAFGVRENAFHKFSEAGMADMGAVSTSFALGRKMCGRRTGAVRDGQHFSLRTCDVGGETGYGQYEPDCTVRYGLLLIG